MAKKETTYKMSIDTSDLVSAQKLMESIVAKIPKIELPLISGIKQIDSIVGQIDELNKKTLKYINDTVQVRTVNIQKEIELNQQVHKSILKNIELYENKEKTLIDQSIVEKELVKKTFEEQIELAKVAAESTEQIEYQKAERIKAIDTKLKFDLKQNTESQLSTTNVIIDEYLKNISDKANNLQKHSGGLWKGVINVEATKKNLNDVKEELEDYKKVLDSNKIAVTKHYSDLEKQYDKDSTEYAQMQDEKIKTLKIFELESGKVDKTISEVDKKGHNLRLQYWKEYADKAKKDYESYTKTIGEVNKYIDLGFDLLNKKTEKELNAAKEKLEKIEGEINANKQIIKNTEAEVNDLTDKQRRREYELAMMRSELSTDEIKSREDELIAIQTSMNGKNEVLSKAQVTERELNEKKKKEEDKVKKLEKEQKKNELNQQLVKAIADVAVGVAKAWSYGPIAGGILSAVVATAGAIQIKKIKDQRKELDKAEQGGLLRGRRHRDGGMRIEGTNIEVEGGEYVVNRRSTMKNLALLEYINANDRPLRPTELMTATNNPNTVHARVKHHLEDGGQIPTVEAATQNNNEQLIEAIKRIKIDSRVSVTDIANAQDNYARVEKWVGF